MNGTMFSVCCNIAGSLAHFLSCQNVPEAMQLFSNDATVELPLTCQVYSGKDKIDHYFSELLDQKAKTLYFLNSPYIYEKQDVLHGSFFLIGIQLKADSSQMFGSRWDIIFTEDFKIAGLSWYDMLWLSEGPNQMPEDPFVLYPGFTAESVLRSGLSAEDWFSVRHLLSRRIHSSISDSQDIIELPYSPVIFGQDDHAQAVFLTIELIKSSGEEKYDAVMEQVFLQLKKEQHWEILQETHKPFITLFCLEGLSGPPQVMEMINRKLNIPLPEIRHTFSSCDEMQIELQAEKWTGAIRSCDPKFFSETALASDAQDLCADIILPVSGVRGFEDEFATMNKMWELQPGFQGVHTMTAGCIEQIGDNEAEGLWLDLGWTMFGPMFGNTKEQVPVLPNIGRYRIKLRRYGDDWKVYDLNWGPLIQYGMWSFELQKAKGWAGLKSEKQWPGLEETMGTGGK